MNEKTKTQIENMKNKRSVSRLKLTTLPEIRRQGLHLNSSEPTTTKTRRTSTDTTPGAPGINRVESGSFREMSASQEPTGKNARWSRRYLPTRIWKACRS